MKGPAVPAPLAQLAVNTIKMLAVDGVEHANSGHPGLPMGAAPTPSPLDALPALRPDRSHVARPRSLRPFVWARVDVALLDAASRGV